MFYLGKGKVYLLYTSTLFGQWKRSSFCSCFQYCLGFPQPWWGGAVCLLVTWPIHAFPHWLVISLKTKEYWVMLAVSQPTVQRVGKWANGQTWWNSPSAEHDCKINLPLNMKKWPGHPFPRGKIFQSFLLMSWSFCSAFSKILSYSMFS